MWPSEADILEEKKAFALAWLKQSDPFKAAVSVFGATQAGKCLKIADEWPRDAAVLGFCKTFKEEMGEEAFLASKAELARAVMDLSQAPIHVDYKLKSLRLYAEIMGYIAKPENDGANKATGVVAVPITPTEAKL